MQITTSVFRKIILSLLVLLLVTSPASIAQKPLPQKNVGTETKKFWKKNEILVGLGSALLFTGIVYAFWRKKKKGFGNLDSTV